MDNKTIYIIIGIAALLFILSTRSSKPKQNTPKFDINFPCSYYHENKPAIIEPECLNQLLKEAGCPTPSIPVPLPEPLPPMALSVARNELIKPMTYMPDARHLCYGPDKSKWPVYTHVPYVTGRYVSIGFPNDLKGSLSFLEMEVIDNRGVVVSYKKPVSGKNITIENPGSRLTDTNYGRYFDMSEEIIDDSDIPMDMSLENSTAKLAGKEPGEFFEIDLGKSYNISYITIANGSDDFEQFVGTIVIISNKPNREEPVYTSNPIPLIEEQTGMFGMSPESLVFVPPNKDIISGFQLYINRFSPTLPTPPEEDLLPTSYIRRRY